MNSSNIIKIWKTSGSASSELVAQAKSHFISKIRFQKLKYCVKAYDLTMLSLNETCSTELQEEAWLVHHSMIRGRKCTAGTVMAKCNVDGFKGEKGMKQ